MFNRDDLKRLTKERIEMLYPQDILEIFNMFAYSNVCGFKAKDCKVLIEFKGYGYALTIDDVMTYSIPEHALKQLVRIWRFRV